MKTIIYKDDYLKASELLDKGGLVAVPTETVYGLAGNGLDGDIIEKIYEVKGRPAYKPISLMVPDISYIERYTVNAPVQAYELAGKFWPGPLTIILSASGDLPKNLLAGGTTVGLRCPASPKTLDLLKALSYPLAVPSANISGKPSPKNAYEVLSGMDGLIEGVIDGGQCELGFESTIIDMSRTPYSILRHGSLPDDEIYSALIKKMCIIGIAGCTGAGKTTALNILKDEGFRVVDCDRLYHHLLDENADMLQEIFDAFPAARDESSLNRKKLGGIVFNDASALAHLNDITHKYVKASIMDIIKETALDGMRKIAIDAVELFSSGLADLCTFTTAVLADKDIRLKRLLLRDGISEKEALLRIGAQKDDLYYINNADHVIYNNSDEAQLRSSIRNIMIKENVYE